MKKQIICWLAFILSGGAFAQNSFWEERPGAPGGYAELIVQSQPTGTVFASVKISPNDGMHKSIDGGQTWQLILDPANNPYGITSINASVNGVLYGLAPSPNYLNNIYKSVDEGITWSPVASDTRWKGWEEDIDGTVFAYELAQSYMKLFKSTNGGVVWDTIADVFSGYNPEPLSELGVLSISGPTGIHVSIDAGITWDTIGTIPDIVDYYLLPTGVYFIINRDFFNGDDELVVGNWLTDTSQVVIPDPSASMGEKYTRPMLLNNGDVLIGVNGKIYVSNDQGLTWALLADNTRVSNFPGYKQLSNGKILATKCGTIFASNDNGLTFNLSNIGLHLHGDNISKLAKGGNPEQLWTFNHAGLHKSSDDGFTWTNVGGQIVGRYDVEKRFALANNDTLLLIEGGQLLSSTDNGSTFTDISPVGININPVSAVFFIEAIHAIFLRTNGALYRSVNYGVSWQQATLPNTIGAWDVIKRHSSGRLIAATDRGNIIKSDDDGLSWQSAATILNSGIVDLEISHDSVIYLFNRDIDGNSFIRKSVNAGDTWTIVNIPNIYRCKSMALNSMGHIFVSAFISNTGHFVVLSSSNGGDNWTLLPPLDIPYDIPVYVDEAVLFIDGNDHLYSSLYTYQMLPFRLIKSAQPTSNGAYLQGNVTSSDDEDCSTIDPVDLLRHSVIEAVGENTWYTTTDSLADYHMYLDTGSYQVSVKMPIPSLWDTCSVLVNLPVENDTTTLDLSLPPLAECPFVTVELTIPELQHCGDSDVYLQYCNYGTITADSVVLFVALDTFLSITSNSPDWLLLNTNNIQLPCFPVGLDSNAVAWYLTVGSLGVGECAQVTANVLVDCDAVPGQVHCMTAHACPDEFCLNQPNWSGANIEVDAYCVGDSVQMTIRNAGTGPSQVLDFVVIEDDVVLLQGEEDYSINEVVELRFPANGEYFRIESEQEPGHPFPQPVAAWEVGCNGDPLPSAAFVNQYYTIGGYASEDTDCHSSIAAPPGNSTAALPTGYGVSQQIAPNIALEYTVYFDNITAVNVGSIVIRDTLSSNLDPTTVRMGPSSHPYTWKLEGQGTLVIRFEDANLRENNPYDTAGFVSFRVSQQPHLPVGTDIYNSAAIYFDLAPPVMTNLTHHRIGVDFFGGLDAVTDIGSPSKLVTAYPNPATIVALVDANGAVELQLYDLQGNKAECLVQEQAGQFMVRRHGLPSGVYIMALISSDGLVINRGKLVFK